MGIARSLQSMKEYSSLQFAFFRIIFGLYLACHFLALIPFAPEIFSTQGTLPDPSLNFTAGLFPNALVWMDQPAGTRLFVSFLALLSIFYTLGFYRRPASFFLWYGMACLFNRNNLIANPSLPYVGWLLLATAMIPSGEAFSLDAKRNKKDKGPSEFVSPVLFYGAWALLAIGYGISGYAKLKSPSWADGTALIHLVENPLARDYFLRNFFLSLPPVVLKLMTWGALSMELLFLPLCFGKRSRALAWAGSVGMHLGILSVVDFADLTFGMLVFHLFIFDPAWFEKVSNKVAAARIFNGFMPS